MKKNKVIFNEYDTYKIFNSEKLSEVYKDYEPFVDLTITSPPYWDAKDYGGVEDQMGFKQSLDEYKQSLKTIFTGVYNISKENASLYLIIDTIKRNNRIIRLPDIIANILEEIGWYHQDTIIWNKVKTLPWSRKGQTRNIFEYIMVFSKSAKNFTYNDDSITVVEPKSWWKDYPERYSPRGTIPENIWTFTIPAQGSWGQTGDTDKLNHACPFPAKLVNRIIRLSSNPGDVIFDPFSGSGVELLIAEKLDRRFFGTDVNNEYREMFLTATRSYVDKEWEEIINEDRLNQKNINTFKNLILNLRCIKYGKELLKRLMKKNDTCKGIIVEADICESFTKHHIADCKCTIILKNDTDKSEVLNEINNIINKAPMSKYGIKPEIIAVYENELINKVWGDTKFIYRTYKASENHSIFSPGTLDELNTELNKELPFILSNICIIKDELDLIKTID